MEGRSSLPLPAPFPCCHRPTEEMNEGEGRKEDKKAENKEGKQAGKKAGKKDGDGS